MELSLGLRLKMPYHLLNNLPHIILQLPARIILLYPGKVGVVRDMVAYTGVLSKLYFKVDCMRFRFQLVSPCGPKNTAR